MYMLGAVSMLSLLKVAQQFTQAAGSDRASFQAIGDSLLAVREEAILAGVFSFALGALMYYYVFYRSGLVPRWLSGWGIAGELLMLVACLSALFSRNPRDLLHRSNTSDSRAGDGHGGLADSQGIPFACS